MTRKQLVTEQEFNTFKKDGYNIQILSKNELESQFQGVPFKSKLHGYVVYTGNDKTGDIYDGDWSVDFKIPLTNNDNKDMSIPLRYYYEGKTDCVYLNNYGTKKGLFYVGDFHESKCHGKGFICYCLKYLIIN